MKTIQNNKQRFLGLDFFRFVCILSISLFHAINLIIDGDADAIPIYNESLFKPIYHLARAFSNSGHTIVAISFFLLGVSSTKKSSLLRGGLFSILGTFILYSMQLKDGYWLEWDIFQYLLCAFASVAFLKWVEIKDEIVLLLSIILLSLPWPSYFENLTNVFLKQSLLGLSPFQDEGGWFLLPWLFMATLFWSFGRCYHNYKKYLLYFGVALLLFGFSDVAIFQKTDLFHYYRYQFAIAPCRHFFYVGLFLVFLHPIWNRPQFGLKHIANLQWSKNFGLCYLVQILLFNVVFLLNLIESSTLSQKIDLCFVIFLIVPEILLRAVFKTKASKFENSHYLHS